MAITISGSGITSANIADGTIVNGDIHPGAAISGSKLTGVTPTKADIDALAVNAGTLDGVDSSQFLRSDVEDATTQRTIFKACETNNWDTIATSAGSQGAFEVLNTGAGNDAFMTFHASEDYAGYFGLDADTNDLAWGGWSVGAVKHKIWHDGNTAGKVLQMTYNTSTAITSTTSTGLVSSGYSVSITPKKIGSKIRVQFHTNFWTNAAPAGGGVAIYNGTTNLHAAANYGMGDFVYSNVGTDDYMNLYTEAFYTTTSLTTQTFTLWFRSWTGSTVKLNQHAGMPTAVATEIA